LFESKISRKTKEVRTPCELQPGDSVLANRDSSITLGMGEAHKPGYKWYSDVEDYRHTMCALCVA